MKYFLLLPLLLVCMAATAFAADFSMTGAWIVKDPKANDLKISMELYRDGRIIMGKHSASMESTYTIEQGEGDSLVYIIVAFPAEAIEKFEEPKPTALRFTARILDLHTISIQAMEGIGESGAVIHREDAPEPVIFERLH